MIEKLTPYPDSRETGFPWLGSVPAHWQVRSLGSLITRRSERGRPDLQLLSVVREKGVIPRSTMRDDENHNFVPDDLSNYKVVRRGNLVINKMKAWQGSLGVSSHDGVVSPAYFVYDLRVSNLEFAHALLRSKPYVAFFGRASDGVRVGQWDLSIDGMKRIPVVLPPPDEQAAIVRFLGHADRRIRKQIAAKRKLIDLMLEQWSSRVRAAIESPGTRFERISSICRHEVRPVERGEPTPFTALGLFNRGRGIFHKPPLRGEDLGASTFSWVEPGDLVISGQFAWEGAVAIASMAERDTIISHRYYALRGRPDVALTSWLLALLRSDYGAMLLNQHSRGAAGRNRPLNLRTLLKERVAVPPLTVQEQAHRVLQQIAPVQDRVVQEVAFLREFRTRLVADVVTGQLDVRAAAAAIPDEPADDEPLDDTDASLDDDGQNGGKDEDEEDAA